MNHLTATGARATSLYKPASPAAIEIAAFIAGCIRELARLRQRAAECTAPNEAEGQLRDPAFAPATRTGLPKAPASPVSFRYPAWRPDSRLWRERAQQTRADARQIDDPIAKRHLLEMAGRYERIARACSPNAGEASICPGHAPPEARKRGGA
jgi:hypothetical protein